MDRLFRIDFYPQDWLIDTARLTPEQRGIYIQIVMLIYANRGPIVNDPVWIAGVSGCSSRMVKSIIKKLSDINFVQVSDGKIGQKRAENELNLKRTHLELSSKGGRVSAEKRAKSFNNNDLLSTETHNSVPTPSPSPSPSPTAIAKIDQHQFENRKGKLVSNQAIDFATKMAIEHGFKGGDENGVELEREFLNFITEQPRNPDAAFKAWVPKFLANVER